MVRDSTRRAIKNYKKRNPLQQTKRIGTEKPSRTVL